MKAKGEELTAPDKGWTDNLIIPFTTEGYHE